MGDSKMKPDIVERLKIVQAKLDKEGNLLIVQESDYRWIADAITEIERLRAPGPSVRAMEEALTGLANAADEVGVKFFDTDTMDPLVEAMQAATLKAREIARSLTLPTPAGGEPDKT